MAKKIALDAGHGLNTSGKQTPDGIKEWTLNDKVRDKVVAILKDYDVEIIHTDKDEGKTDESLSSRWNMYVKAKVDAFVSIHHNAYTSKWNNATGVEVFTDRNGTAKDKKLAKLIYDRMVKNTGLKGRGVKEYDFAVINQDTIPAVLCEGGFMDGTEDYKYITSAKGQTAYAKAVAEGLIEFLDLKKKTATKPATTTKPTTKPSTTKKSVATIAQEVIDGKWGNGDARKTAIEKAGYSYDEVQAKVNELLNKDNKKDTSFKVQVTANSLRIRKGPSTEYGTAGYINDKGVYTIVETKSGKGSDKGWGKLKSGAGWISLDYTTRK